MNTTHRIYHFRLAFAAIALLLAVAVSLFTACNNHKTDGITRIAYVPITHSLPLFAMQELPRNMRLADSVQLIKFASWTELTDALNSGCVDGAMLLTEIAVKARERGVPLKAVALGHHDGNVVVVSNSIAKAEDLRGKTIAIPHRLSSHNLLLAMVLEKHGMSMADVRVTELPPPEMPAALAENRIAAYIVAEPFGAKAIVLGVGRVLYSSPELWPHSVCCTLVLHEDLIANHRPQAEALVHDYHLAADSLARSSDWQLQVAGKYLSVPSAVLQKSLGWIDFADLRYLPSQHDVLSRWMLKLNLCQDSPAFSDMADSSLWNKNEH